MNNLSTLLFAIVITGITGCASQSVKDAVSNMSKRDVAYGAVIDIKPGDSEQTQKNCANNHGDKRWATFCADRSAYKQAKIAYFHSSRLVTTTVAVPVDLEVQQGSIIQTKPNGDSVATRVAAFKQNDACQWTGHPLEELNSATGIAKGFVAGLLIVPTIAITVDDSILEGGVECDGWSYKTLLKNTGN
jgi:hypothetical protein